MTIAGGKLKRHLNHKPSDKVREEKQTLPEDIARRKIRNMGILQSNKKTARDGGDNFEAIHKFEGTVAHCKSCQGAYAKHGFYEHKTKCPMQQEKAAECVKASVLAETSCSTFQSILSAFREDEAGTLCRTDATLKFLGSHMWKKEKSKVGKTDEVHKIVMNNMRMLARLYITFRVHHAQTTSVLDMFNRKNYAELEAAIIEVTIELKGVLSSMEVTTIEKHKPWNPENILSVMTVTLVKNKFIKVLKFNENTIFADSMYMMNLSHQERLHLPDQLPPRQL